VVRPTRIARAIADMVIGQVARPRTSGSLSRRPLNGKYVMRTKIFADEAEGYCAPARRCIARLTGPDVSVVGATAGN